MNPRFFLAAALISASCSVYGDEVTGKWKADFTTQIGHLKYVYELKADGEKLTGKAFRDLDGEKTDTAIAEGKIKGDEVSFVENAKYQDQEVRIEYSGKLAGDEIKFTRKVGDFATTEIVATRAKDSPVAVDGKWRAEFDTQIGKQKYLYVFKVDGGKLTGRATGDIAGEKSDTEISEGKVQGTEISFLETVKFQGQDVPVNYTGKVSGDEIKFTRKVADFATEEMVAKRVKDN